MQKNQDFIKNLKFKINNNIPFIFNILKILYFLKFIFFNFYFSKTIDKFLYMYYCIGVLIA